MKFAEFLLKFVENEQFLNKKVKVVAFRIFSKIVVFRSFWNIYTDALRSNGCSDAQSFTRMLKVERMPGCSDAQSCTRMPKVERMLGCSDAAFL